VWVGPRHRLRRVGSTSPIFAEIVAPPQKAEALLFVQGPEVEEGSTLRRLCERVAEAAGGTLEELPAHPQAADLMKPKRAKAKKGASTEWSDAELKRWWKEHSSR
jgi:hypothetical protein